MPCCSSWLSPQQWVNWSTAQLLTVWSSPTSKSPSFIYLSLLSAQEPCVFPFELDGHSYNGCIYNHNGLEPWCPTEVDELSFPVASRPCVHGDPKEQSTCSVIPPSSPTKCIFPFKYLGKSYTECTFDDDTEAWCATGLDLFGNMVGEKARCGDDCNVQQPPTPRLLVCQLL